MKATRGFVKRNPICEVGSGSLVWTQQSKRKRKKCILCQAKTGRGTVESLRMSDLPRGT